MNNLNVKGKDNIIEVQKKGSINMLDKVKEKLNIEIKDLKNPQLPVEPIIEYLTTECKENNQLCESILKEEKTLDGCIKDIMYEAEKRLNGKNGYLKDDVVYEFAKNYYLVEKTERELDEKKKEEERAARKKANEERALKNKNKKKKGKSSDNNENIDLFSVAEKVNATSSTIEKLDSETVANNTSNNGKSSDNNETIDLFSITQKVNATTSSTIEKSNVETVNTNTNTNTNTNVSYSSNNSNISSQVSLFDFI